MITQILFLLAGLTAATASLSAQAFEGRVTMTMKEGSSKPMVVNYAMKKDLIRFDMKADKGETASSIMNFAKKEMIMLMPSEKMYMVMPMQDLANAAKTAAETTSPLEKTNETEVILGYTCTKYIARDKDSVTEIWAAEGIGMFAMGSANPMKPSPRNAWEAELVEKGFFPLRVIGKNNRGREQFRLDVTAIDKQSLPDSEFIAPADYQRFDMGGGMGGMMKGALKGALPFGR
ncbi:hypothetical protein MASR2M8_06290 [Opitutaceae bacterium]